MNKLNLSGVYGELRTGHVVVARFSAWQMAGAGDGTGRIEATTSSIDTFRLEQGGPFSVRVQMGKRYWVWREAEVLDPGSPFVVRAHGSPTVM